MEDTLSLERLTASIKPIRDCLSRHRREHIFMEDTLSLERLVTWYKALETAYPDTGDNIFAWIMTCKICAC